MKTKTFFGVNGPYLTVQTLLDCTIGRRFSICLHDFHRGDEDPDCHDHPFHFLSIILRGSYREHLYGGRSVDRRRFSWALRRATHRHRVELLHQPVLTLCIKLDAKREWGFWKDGNFIPWRDYIKLKGLEPIGDRDEPQATKDVR
jgi:hypothetical protein